MLRVAKPLQYLLISPSKEQVRTQNPQEGIPLIMEPHSGLQTVDLPARSSGNPPNLGGGGGGRGLVSRFMLPRIREFEVGHAR